MRFVGKFERYYYMQTWLYIYVLYVCLCRKEAEGSSYLDPVPQNVAVLLGDRFWLACGSRSNRTDTIISWWRDEYFLGLENNMKEGYNNRMSKDGTSVLSKEIAHLHDAGTYHCKVTYGDSIERRAYSQVIVLERKQINCASNETDIAIEDEVVAFDCEVMYSGRWPPRLDWSAPGFDISNTSNESEPGTARYRMINKASRAMHMTPFTCSGRFDTAQYAQAADHAQNALTFDFEVCNLKPLAVHWPPTENRISISPSVSKRGFMLGTKMHCMAHTNPVPNSIRWRNVTDYISDDDIVELQGSHDGHVLYCEVKSVVGKKGEEKLRIATREVIIRIRKEEGDTTIYNIGGRLKPTYTLFSYSMVVTVVTYIVHLVYR